MLQIEVGETGELALEEQVDLAGRAVPLFLDQQFGAVVHLFHVALPLLHGVVKLLLIVESHLLWRTLLQIVFVAIDKENGIRILFDRARFA